MTPSDTLCTAFDGHKRFTSGTFGEVARMVRGAGERRLVVFEDATGRVVDIDARSAPRPEETPELRGRGRPRLGVVAREVTLLPRHWDWLNAQPGGASVALRRLVEEARRSSGDRDRVRQSQEAAYRFLTAVGGDLPGFEEALRALFAYDRRRFADLLAAWPEDIREYAVRLAFADLKPGER